MKFLWHVLKRTISKWQQDKASRSLAAALAYFTAISIAPLTLLVIVIAGYLWGGEQAAKNELLSYVRSVMGANSAEFVDVVVSNADTPSFGNIAGLVSVSSCSGVPTPMFLRTCKSAQRHLACGYGGE